MKLNSWQLVAVLVVGLSGLFLITPANGFTTPAWPPNTTPQEGGGPVFTTPDWPPNTTQEDTTVEDTTVTPDTTPSPTPAPPGDTAADENNAWMIVGIIFIVLTVVLAIVAIYLFTIRQR